MRPPQQARVPDPRQGPMERAMNGVHFVTVAQRNKIIADARARYAKAIRAQQAAQRARRGR